MQNSSFVCTLKGKLGGFVYQYVNVFPYILSLQFRWVTESSDFLLKDMDILNFYYLKETTGETMFACLL